MSNLSSLIENKGYRQAGYGYRKVTNSYTHWITDLPSSNSLQLYSYETNDTDLDFLKEKIYDTGVISVSIDELNILIDILLRNHN